MVKTGLERLKEISPSWLKEDRIGLLCHQASVDRGLRHAKEVIWEIVGDRLKALFSPQHGLWGERQANMEGSPDGWDPQLGVPVYSLYGQRRRPKREQLEGIDTLVVDLQDVGVRTYTYATTMALCMEEAAKVGIRVVVLDRPNPIGGEQVEGNLLKEGLRSFVGYAPLPMRHGMTMGELALFFNTSMKIGAELEVIPMEGWGRKSFEDTGLPWVMPSPNIPAPETALTYAGQVLLEGTNLSEGRGTTRPFELCGAPYIDASLLLKHLEGKGLPGVIFREAHFIPTFDKWEGEVCHGVQVHVIDPEAFRPYLTALTLIKAVMELWPEEFSWRPPPYEYETSRLPFDLISGDPQVRQWLEEGMDPFQMQHLWEEELEAFSGERARFLLY